MDTIEPKKRGYKTCPNCQQSCGLRTFQCKCGYSFQTKKMEPIVEKEPPKPEGEKIRRGCKICEGCKQEIGIRSVQCKLCGYNYSTRQVEKIVEVEKHRKPVFAEDELEALANEIVNEETAPPPTTEKACPDCKHVNYYKALICDRCSYDFVNQCPKKAKEEPKEKEEERLLLGAVPRWELFPKFDWMEYRGGANPDNTELYRWARHFLSEWRTLLGVIEVYPGWVCDWADMQTTGFLATAEARYHLGERFGNRSYIPYTITDHPQEKCMRLWQVTSTEARDLQQYRSRKENTVYQNKEVDAISKEEFEKRAGNNPVKICEEKGVVSHMEIDHGDDWKSMWWVKTSIAGN